MSPLKYLAPLALLLGCTILGTPRPVPTAPRAPEELASATFMVSTPDHRGTAWVVSHDPGGLSYLVTAGHVCSPGDPGPYELTPFRGVEHPAVVVFRSEEPDLCLLVSSLLAAPLPLADTDPMYGEPVAYVGAIRGRFGGGMATYFSGTYSGAGYAAIPGWGGASGAAVVTTSGVVGVLVARDAEFPEVVQFVTLRELRAWLKERLP